MIHTIGELMDALERYNEDTDVFFEFGFTRPSTIASWRGDYSMAALGFELYSRSNHPATVGSLHAELMKAISGLHYLGYKGGDYTFNRDTQLWVDNWGDGSHTRITKVHLRYDDVVLRCKWKDY